MGLIKRRQSNTVYLQVKHFCLWQGIKQEVAGCESIEVTNPRTGDVITKYGYRFDTVMGLAAKLEKYDTGQKWGTRYFGFRLHLVDGNDLFVLDMPYQSQILRRFLRVAPRLDWAEPFSITVFKGKGKAGSEFEQTGVWFQQADETVKPHFSREEPHGMPEATFDNDLQQWDFRAQHRWLVAKLQTETMPAIDAAASARTSATPVAEHVGEQEENSTTEIPPHPDYIDDDDVPF